MKKHLPIRILVGAVAVSSLWILTVSAEEAAPAEVGISTVSAEEKTTAVTMAAEEEKDTKYMLSVYTVGSVERTEAGGYTVTLDGDSEGMGLVCHLTGPVFVIDQADLSDKTMDDLTVGRTVTAVRDTKAPTTMSIPAQTSGVAGFILNADPGYAVVDQFDENLVNPGNTLQLNIGKDTILVDQQGSKLLYGAEDLKNKELLVLYTTTTRSIPAQTTPQLVMLMTAGTESETATPLPLRATAEAKDYTVTWTGNDKPIVLTKENQTIQVTIGTKTALVNGEEKTLAVETVLVGVVTMVSPELAGWL